MADNNQQLVEKIIGATYVVYDGELMCADLYEGNYYKIVDGGVVKILSASQKEYDRTMEQYRICVEEGKQITTAFELNKRVRPGRPVPVETADPDAAKKEMFIRKNPQAVPVVEKSKKTKKKFAFFGKKEKVEMGIRCEVCSHVNPEGQKFCGNCGERLAKIDLEEEVKAPKLSAEEDDEVRYTPPADVPVRKISPVVSDDDLEDEEFPDPIFAPGIFNKREEPTVEDPKKEEKEERTTEEKTPSVPTKTPLSYQDMDKIPSRGQGGIFDDDMDDGINHDIDSEVIFTVSADDEIPDFLTVEDMEDEDIPVEPVIPSKPNMEPVFEMPVSSDEGSVPFVSLDGMDPETRMAFLEFIRMRNGAGDEGARRTPAGADPMEEPGEADRVEDEVEDEPVHIMPESYGMGKPMPGPIRRSGEDFEGIADFDEHEDIEEGGNGRKGFIGRRKTVKKEKPVREKRERVPKETKPRVKKERPPKEKPVKEKEESSGPSANVLIVFLLIMISVVCILAAACLIIPLMRGSSMYSKAPDKQSAEVYYEEAESAEEDTASEEEASFVNGYEVIKVTRDITAGDVIMEYDVEKTVLSSEQFVVLNKSNVYIDQDGNQQTQKLILWEDLDKIIGACVVSDLSAGSMIYNESLADVTHEPIDYSKEVYEIGEDANEETQKSNTDETEKALSQEEENQVPSIESLPENTKIQIVGISVDEETGEEQTVVLKETDKETAIKIFENIKD